MREATKDSDTEEDSSETEEESCGSGDIGFHEEELQHYSRIGELVPYSFYSVHLQDKNIAISKVSILGNYYRSN